MASGNKEHIQHLCAAVQAGNNEEVDRILQQGMYINADEGGNMLAKSLYRNLLMLAVDSLQAETAKFLIKRGIDVNHKVWGINGKQSARDLALENGLDDIVDLIDANLPVSKRLFFAVVDGHHGKVETLMKHIDADMNMKVDVYGDKAAGCTAYTLLMIALKNGYVEISELLIDHGIDLDFEHQEWDRPDATSEPILVESYDARKLAMDTGMVGVAKMIDKRRRGSNEKSIDNGVGDKTAEVDAVIVNGDGNANANTPLTAINNQHVNVTKRDQRKAAGCVCIIS